MTGGNNFISVRDSNEMARTKQTARRGQGGKAGAGGGAVLTKARPTMGGKEPSGGGGPMKPHQFRPGTVTLWEIENIRSLLNY